MVRWWKLLGLVLLGLCLVPLVWAQPAPEPTIPLLDRLARLLDATLTWVGSAGAVMLVGLVARLWRPFRNEWVPILLGVGNVATTFGLVLKKLAEAATGVAYVDDQSMIQYAGFLGSLGGLVVTGLGAAATAGAGVVQRLLWEKYLRHACYPNGQAGKAGF